MSKKELDLKVKFEKYFHEIESYGLRSERFYDLIQQYSESSSFAAAMKEWMEAAFIQGAMAIMELDNDK